MNSSTATLTGSAVATSGWRGLVADWSSDRQAFHVSWGKAMMSISC